MRQRLPYLEDKTYQENPRHWYDEGRRRVKRDLLAQPLDEQERRVAAIDHPSGVTHWRYDPYSLRHEKDQLIIVYYRPQ